MMAATIVSASLIDRLPPVRGRYAEGAPMSKATWFRVGGPAEVVFRPADLDDLKHFLANKPVDVPVFTLGAGSNLLVRDGGMAGVVIRLGGPFAGIAVEGDTIRAGAAALDLNVAKTAARAGLAGLEFLSGIPGTVGGALRMNAGAYGRETKDVLLSAISVSGVGEVVAHTVRDLGFRYRHSDSPADHIFVEAVFQTAPGDRGAIDARMAEIQTARIESQPIRSRTGGSTFKNPDGMKAWRLIDEAGCRGLTLGGAQVSTRHCNFLVNTGAASATDLENLGEDVRARVKNRVGVSLEWEIRRTGETLRDLAAGGAS